MKVQPPMSRRTLLRGVGAALALPVLEPIAAARPVSAPPSQVKPAPDSVSLPHALALWAFELESQGRLPAQ